MILKVLLIKKEPPTNQVSTRFINKQPGSCGSEWEAAACPGPAPMGIWVGKGVLATALPLFSSHPALTGHQHHGGGWGEVVWVCCLQGGCAGGKPHPTSHREAKKNHSLRTERWAKPLAPLLQVLPEGTLALPHHCPTAFSSPIPPLVQESIQRAPRSWLGPER